MRDDASDAGGGSMKIAIIGAGNVGGGLGAGLAEAGHEIVYGVRDPNSAKTRSALDATPHATASEPGMAASEADVVIVALRWDAVPDTVAGLPDMDGGVVIDAMNRLGGDPARSTAEDLADLLPGARLVKAFNTIGFENFATARARRQKAVMFIAGDHPEANAVAATLATDLGFQPEDVGPLTNAKPLEEMVKIWLALAQRHGRRVGWALSEE
jgi:8-hydroxy-5-deazaflavin:NADPH oxidoreductase